MLNEILDETAVHEAGHALVAWHSPYIIAINAVIIAPSRGGIVTCEWRDAERPETVWDYLTTVLAGVAAETLLLTKANYLSAATDLFGAIEASNQLLETEWSIPVGLAQSPLKNGLRNHPNFDLLEYRLGVPCGTAAMMHAAYHRAYHFLKHRKLALIKIAVVLKRFHALDHARLILVLGPRLATIRAAFGFISPLDAISNKGERR